MGRPISEFPERCAGCPYRKSRMCGTAGDPDAPLLIIGEAPGKDEIRKGRPFVGKAGQLLDRVMERVGLSRSDAFITNAMFCQPTDSPPSEEAIDSCADRVWKEATSAPRRLTITLGNSALRSLTGDHSLKITQVRGRPIDLEGLGRVLPSVHPASVLRNMHEYGPFVRDLQYAASLFEGGAGAIRSPGEPKYQVIKTREGYKRAIDFLLAKEALGADIETDSLTHRVSPREYPTLGEILALGVAYARNRVVIVPEEVLYGEQDLTARLMESEGPRWIWHNGKFDVPFIRARLDVDARVDEDTMLLHYTLDEKKDTHSLEHLVQEYLGGDPYKGNIGKPWRKKASDSFRLVPPEILYERRLAPDADNTLQLWRLFHPKLAKSKSLTWLYYKHLLPAQDFLMEVEDRGMPVDREFLEGTLIPTMEKLTKEALAEFRREAKPVWDPEVYAREVGAKKVPTELNPASSKQVIWVLNKLGFKVLETTELSLRAADRGAAFTTKSARFGRAAGDTHTSGVRTIRRVSRARADTLVAREDKSAVARNPIIRALLTHRAASKLLSSFGTGLVERIAPDGRIHSSFWLHGTETGRLSASDPNLQNIPAPRKREPVTIKNAFKAPPGYVFVYADYSQVELRLLAHFSNDEWLKSVYREDRDLHNEVALAMYGEGYTEDQRMRAKAVNFGIAYGRGAESMADEFAISVEEARDIIDKWRARMPDAAAFIRHTRKAVLRGRTITNVFGRRRRFGVITRENLNLLQNEGSNFPMQSTASDLTLRSAMALQEEFKRRGWDAGIVNLIHDALLAEVPEEHEEEAKALVERVMEEVPARILKPQGIAFVAKAKSARAWGEC